MPQRPSPASLLMSLAVPFPPLQEVADSQSFALHFAEEVLQIAATRCMRCSIEEELSSAESRSLILYHSAAQSPVHLTEKQLLSLRHAKVIIPSAKRGPLTPGGHVD